MTAAQAWLRVGKADSKPTRSLPLGFPPRVKSVTVIPGWSGCKRNANALRRGLSFRVRTTGVAVRLRTTPTGPRSLRGKNSLDQCIHWSGAQDTVRLGRCGHLNYFKSSRPQAPSGCRAEDCIFFHDQDDRL